MDITSKFPLNLVYLVFDPKLHSLQFSVWSFSDSALGQQTFKLYSTFSSRNWIYKKLKVLNVTNTKQKKHFMQTFVSLPSLLTKGYKAEHFLLQLQSSFACSKTRKYHRILLKMTLVSLGDDRRSNLSFWRWHMAPLRIHLEKCTLWTDTESEGHGILLEITYDPLGDDLCSS